MINTNSGVRPTRPTSSSTTPMVGRMVEDTSLVSPGSEENSWKSQCKKMWHLACSEFGVVIMSTRAD
jgi:hypothetical protein